MRGVIKMNLEELILQLKGYKHRVEQDAFCETLFRYEGSSTRALLDTECLIHECGEVLGKNSHSGLLHSNLKKVQDILLNLRHSIWIGRNNTDRDNTSEIIAILGDLNTAIRWLDQEKYDIELTIDQIERLYICTNQLRQQAELDLEEKGDCIVEVIQSSMEDFKLYEPIITEYVIVGERQPDSTFLQLSLMELIGMLKGQSALLQKEKSLKSKH